MTNNKCISPENHSASSIPNVSKDVEKLPDNKHHTHLPSFCPHPRARLGQFQSQELATSAWALGRFQDRYLSIMRAILEEARPTQRLVLGIGRRMGTTWGLTLKHGFAVWSPTMIITRFSPTYTYIEFRPPRNFTFLYLQIRQFFVNCHPLGFMAIAVRLPCSTLASLKGFKCPSNIYP